MQKRNERNPYETPKVSSNNRYTNKERRSVAAFIGFAAAHWLTTFLVSSVPLEDFGSRFQLVFVAAKLGLIAPVYLLLMLLIPEVADAFFFPMTLLNSCIVSMAIVLLFRIRTRRGRE